MEGLPAGTVTFVSHRHRGVYAAPERARAKGYARALAEHRVAAAPTQPRQFQHLARARSDCVEADGYPPHLIKTRGSGLLLIDDDERFGAV